MKTTLQSLLCIAAISTLTCAPVFAEDGGKADAKPKKEKKAKKNKAPKVSKQVQKQIDALAKSVPDLNAEQKAKLVPVFKAKGDGLKAVKALKEKGGSDEDVAAKRKGINKAANQKIKEILTPAQYKKLTAARKAKAAAKKANKDK